MYLQCTNNEYLFIVPNNTICSGTNVTFTANGTAFTNPSYQSYANGTEISGAISATYSSTSLTNGVQVYVKVKEGSGIVTDGLRFNLDAGNSASYPGTGTTWTDLSSNGNHGTLVNGATYSPDNGGSILFNGTNSNINLNKNATAIGIYDNSYTADAWVYPIYLFNGDRVGIFGDEQTALRKGLHLSLRGGTIYQGHYSSDASIGSVANYNWYHIVFTFDKATGATKIYKNGVYQGNSGTIQSYIGESSIHLGQEFGNSGYFKGKGAVYKMYNRVLSSAEVTSNYNALRSRFGLTGVAPTVVNSTSITTTVNAGPAIPVITITGDACVNKTTLSTPAGLTSYAWYKDNAPISGEISNTYSPTTAGDYKVQVTSGSCSTMSAATTIAVCGVTVDGRMRAITSPTTLVSHEGGVNFGTGVSELGTTVNATGISTTLGTIGATTSVVGGVISSTSARTTNIGVIYSTDSNFGTYSTSSTQSNVAAGTHAITLTSLSSLTNYYVKAFITNKAGTSYGGVVSFTTTSPPKAVGDVYQGGIIFYVLQSGASGYDANVQHGLIAPFNSISRQSTNPLPPIIESQIGKFAATISGAQADGLLVGKTNTDAIILNQGSTGTYAALFCRNYANPTSKTFNSVTYTFPVYTDWNMPRIAEINKFRAFVWGTHLSRGLYTNYVNNVIYYNGTSGNGNDYAWGKYLSSSMTGQNYKLYYLESGNQDGSTAYNGWNENDRLVVMPIRSF